MKLAILTNRPAFEKPIGVGVPIVEKDVQNSYYKYMAGVFKRNYFTNNGPLVQKLESEIANIHGVKYCKAVCNATMGQILTLKVLDLKGEIIVPSFTFIATAHACLWQNIRPVFCDISPTSLMIDIEKAEELITEKTSAIIGVHLFGNICDVEGLEKLCKKYSLKLIFDAAHAFNCTWGDIPIGGFGNASILSFHATKFFGTFEGGAVLTNDAELSQRIGLSKNFGFRGYDDVGFLGINGKMSESSAAMGLASLQAIERRAKKLKETYLIYKEQLSTIPGISLLPLGKKERSNYHYIVILVDEKIFGVSRDVLYNILRKENVIARRYFFPGCHRQEPYYSLFPNTYKRLPVTEEIAKKILCLPSNLEEPKSDISTIILILQTAHDSSNEILKWVKTCL